MTPADSPRTPLGWVPHLWSNVLFPGEPRPAGRVGVVPLLVLLVLPAVMLYPCRGFHLLEPDEGRYAQIPKEMLRHAEWVVPTLQGEPYLDKPPLMYWLVAASYRAFGVTPEAARLVPAVCVHLTILAVFLIGRRSVGGRAAFWAALLLAVAPGFVSVARLLLLDGLLTLCVTASVLCGFEAVRSGRLNLGWWVASAVASGLGFLTKGPISEILLFVPLLAWGWLSRSGAAFSPPPSAGRGGELRRNALEDVPSPGSQSRAALSRKGRGAEDEAPPHFGEGLGRGCGGLRVWHYALFFAIVFLVNLPWYVAMYRREPAFLKHFFWEHNVLRFLQPFDHLQPVWYYAPILAAGLLPGSVLAVMYLRDLLWGRSERPSAAGGFWLLAGGWCVLFFSVSGSKLPTYVLPAYPFMCLALGEFVARTRRDRAASTKAGVAGMAGVVLAVHYVGLPWYARERSPVGRPELVERFVSDPGTTVVCYPRNCDSLAFHADRDDFQKVRTKETNDLIQRSHHRPRTVILFTTPDALAGFKGVLPPSLALVETVSLKRRYGWRLLDKLFGGSPWGLSDVAVVVPLYHVPPPAAAPVARAQGDQE